MHTAPTKTSWSLSWVQLFFAGANSSWLSRMYRYTSGFPSPSRSANNSGWSCCGYPAAVLRGSAAVCKGVEVAVGDWFVVDAVPPGQLAEFTIHEAQIG